MKGVSITLCLAIEVSALLPPATHTARSHHNMMEELDGSSDTVDDAGDMCNMCIHDSTGGFFQHFALCWRRNAEELQIGQRGQDLVKGHDCIGCGPLESRRRLGEEQGG